MKQQLRKMDTSFSPNSTLSTCDPAYYKHTQQLFLDLYHNGLAYKKKSLVNWDPVDKTVLANEQVNEHGYADRSGALVELKDLEQWFFKITDYAQGLLEDLKILDWPEKIKQQQVNWIGKSTGMEIQFDIQNTDQSISVYTTKPETLFGVTFIAISSDHSLLKDSSLFDKYTFDRINQELAIWKIGTSTSDKLHHKKTPKGINTNLSALHPITKKLLPIYVASYVEPTYATASVMGVPAHDDRDFLFHFENSIIKSNELGMSVFENTEKRWSDGILKLSEHGWWSKEIDGENVMVVKEWVGNYLEEKKIGKVATHYKLRDWLVSRQRYWGTPIPIIYCPNCGIVPVPSKDLPVILPVDDIQLSKRGKSVLGNHADYLKCTCPKCNSSNAKRETDTMDTFVDSSWYFLRYGDPTNPATCCAPCKNQLPVDLYIGGIEHAILHLLFARFISKFLHKQLKLGNDFKGEPFKKLLTQGMVQGKTFRCAETGKYLKSGEVDLSDPENPLVKSTGKAPSISWEKMSKSKFNGVDPLEIIEKYGSDVTRLYILYKAPPSDDLSWDLTGIIGMQRFLNRVSNLLQIPTSSSTSNDDELISLNKLTLSTIDKVVDIFSTNFHFNVAISHLIILTNHLSSIKNKDSIVYKQGVEVLLRLLYPFAPETCLKLWNSEKEMTWNFDDVKKMKNTGVEKELVVFMVNGKVRGIVPGIENGASEDAIKETVLKSEQGEKFLKGKTVKRVVFASRGDKGGRIVNFVAF